MRKNNILLLVGIWNVFMPINIWAQIEEEKTPITLDPIIVTAARAERKSLEVPCQVSIISDQEIKDSDAKNIPDLLKDLEGILVDDASGVGTTGNINMRGFCGGMSTYQLILVDGIPQNKGKDKLVDWNLIPLTNIDRIEIVRGSASALYGDNAMSGVINIISKKPSASPETKIAVTYGSYNTQNYNLFTSHSLENLGYYFGISSKLTDGFRKHCDYKSMHLNGKLNYLFNDGQKVKLSLDYHGEERGAYPWALSEVQLAEDRYQARPGSENDKLNANKANLQLTHAWNINELDIEETGYYRYESSASFYTGGSTGEFTNEQLEDENTYGLLLGLNTHPQIFGIGHFFTTGIDLERNTFNYAEYQAPYQVRGDFNADYNVTRSKFGPYFQDEIIIFNPAKLIFGVRYDLVELDFMDQRDESLSKQKLMSKATPKCGLVYTYGENSNLYANYAQAFRTPTIGQMFTYGIYSNPELSPEEATNYEWGLHHQFNANWKASMSVYWIELDNEIWYDFTETKYKNYGKTSHKGLESRLDIGITEGLSGFVNYTYTLAKNEIGIYAGKYLTNIPLHKGSCGIKLETHLGLKANLVVTSMGDAYLDSANVDILSSYTTLDAKMSYGIQAWQAFLALDNLLNRTYNSYGYTRSMIKYFNPAPGRTFTLGLEASF